MIVQGIIFTVPGYGILEYQLVYHENIGLQNFSSACILYEFVYKTCVEELPAITTE